MIWINHVFCVEHLAQQQTLDKTKTAAPGLSETIDIRDKDKNKNHVQIKETSEKPTQSVDAAQRTSDS